MGGSSGPPSRFTREIVGRLIGYVVCQLLPRCLCSVFIFLLSDLLPSPMSSQILRPANCLPNCFLNGLQARSETPFRSLGYEVSTSKPLGSSASLSKSIGGKFSSEATLHRSSLDKASRAPWTFKTQDGRLRPTQYWETRPAGSRLPRKRVAGREDLK